VALDWRGFAAEVERRKPVFWLRDDDAVAVTPALERLLSFGVPVALAVIPELAEPGLLEKDVAFLQHGCDHRNRAAPGEKKTEFPASERDEAALERLCLARERLVSLGGDKVLPVVAPPWNRMRRELAAQLPKIGITGFSGFLDRLLERQAGKSTEHCVATGVNIPLRHFGRGMTGNSGQGPGVTTRLAQPCQESVSKPSSPGQ